MDQPSKTEETDNLDGPSTLHSPSPRHRPGHSGAHHHESQQRGETQQRGGFPHGGTQPHQDFLNIHDNATSFYHPGMSRHQGRHPHQPSTAFGLAPSSINAQHFHDEHHSRTQPGGILHHGGPQHHGRQHHHHGGPHPVIEPVSPQSGVSSNTMTSQHGRGHSQGVPHHLGGHHQQRDPSSQEYAPQQEEDHHRGESRQHGRPPLPDHSRGRSRKQRGENIPHTSSDTSSHPIPSHFCREQRGGPRPSEYHIRDRPPTSTTPTPSTVPLKCLSHASKSQRVHKKYTGNLFQLLWDKFSKVILGLQNMMRTLTQSLGFESFIFVTVCLNTIMLVAQTFAEVEIRGEWNFLVLDCIFLCIYVLEALLKIIAQGVEYFYDGWNNLDFFIMIMAVLDFVLLQLNSISSSFYSHGLFRILKVFKSMRALRALRVLRRLSILTSLQEVTGTLAQTLPSIAAILILMFTCMFLFSVVLRALFRKSDPERFQSIFTTIFTLFTLLTLDDWSLIYLDSRAQGAWYIIPILMVYIIIQYFIFLNLVIAVLVDNFQMALLRGLEKVKQEMAAQIHEKLLDDSLTELNQTGTGPGPLLPPSPSPQPGTESQALF
uniref:Cation channel sperm-associated protein 1 n=1 Tax=Castor canadensis TaxID=51338 RepID=A0A8C0XEN7_CASCN